MSTLMDLFSDDPNYRSLEDDLMSEVKLWIPSVPSLDYAIGGFRPGPKKGIPHGRVIEIYGKESSGKSALLDKIIANFQRKCGGFVLLGDREHAHEAERMLEVGVDPDNIKFIEKKIKHSKSEKELKTGRDITLEEFFEYSYSAFKRIRGVDTETPILVALDSLAVIPTKAQQEIGGDDEYNMKTRLDKSIVMSDKFPDFCTKITENNACLIIVNQIREKPGVSFGNPEYCPGGKTLPFAASLRVELFKSDKIKPSDEFEKDRVHRSEAPIGLRIRFKIVKNKTGAPLREGFFPLFFDDRGIDYEYCLAELLRDIKAHTYCESFDKSGSWFSWKEERIGQGVGNMAVFFKENPDIMEEIEYECFQKED
jgi:recombination protein RecA